MSRRDEHWGAEDEDVVRRLRDEKSRLSGFEFDRIKTMVMARVKPSSSSRRSAPISRWLVGLLTVGAMVAGTAGTLAASNSSSSGGTGAAQSQYRPPKCNPRHEECTCPGGSQRVSRDRCVCPPGQTFGEGSNDCFCPNGTHPAGGKCTTCPDGGTLTDGKCVCPDKGHEEHGKCVHHEPAPPSGGTDHGTAPPTNKPAVKTKARHRTRRLTTRQARVQARRERR
jgi:hypothetical protein